MRWDLRPFLEGWDIHGSKNGLLFWILGISGDDTNVHSYWESLLDV